MRRGWWFLLFGSLVGACAGAGSSSSTNDDGGTLITSGEPDAGTFTFSDDAGFDAGPLLESCDPTSATSCPEGFTCYPTHTSATWWVDLYGKCTFACTSQTLALCASMDGVCGCPVNSSGQSNCVTEAGVDDLEDGSTVSADAAASSSDASTPVPDASESPTPVTPTSMVCVPAVKPGTTPGSNEGDGGCGTPGCGGGPDAAPAPTTGQDAG